MGHLVQPPTQAGSPRAGCTAPHPSGSGISPEKETLQPPWAAWARAPSPSEGRSSSSCSAGASSASVCARCPLSCHWAPLERVCRLCLIFVGNRCVEEYFLAVKGWTERSNEGAEMGIRSPGSALQGASPEAAAGLGFFPPFVPSIFAVSVLGTAAVPGAVVA